MARQTSSWQLQYGKYGGSDCAGAGVLPINVCPSGS